MRDEQYHDEATSDTGPFVIIPEWLLRMDLSHGAVRLYAELATFADYKTGDAWPSRSLLASRLKCSRDTIDRFAKELVSARAITVRRRKTGDDEGSIQNLTNLYTVRRIAPGSRTDTARGGGMVAVRGGGTDAAQTIPIFEQDPINKTREVEVQNVFQQWLSSTGKDSTRTKLDSKRKARIVWALENYSLADVLDAVQGWAKSDFHAGQNKDGKIYNDLTLVLRDSTKLEYFRDRNRSAPDIKVSGTWKRLQQLAGEL